jgi:hypothetical protein
VPIDEASLQDKSPEATRMLETGACVVCGNGARRLRVCAFRGVLHASLLVAQTQKSTTPPPTCPLNRNTEEAKVLLDNTVKLSDVGDPASYDCVFLPGGHGPMFDLAVSEALGELLTTAAAAGAVWCGRRGRTCRESGGATP